MSATVGKKFKIRTKLFAAMVLCIVVFIMAELIVTRAVSQSIVERYLYTYLNATQSEVGNGLQMLFDEVGDVAVRFAGNEDIKRIITDTQLSEAKKDGMLSVAVSDLSVDSELIGDIMVIDALGGKNIYRHKVTDIESPEEAFLRYLDETEEPISYGGIKKDIDGASYLILGRRTVGHGSSGRFGYLIFYVKETMVAQLYEKLDAELGDSYIVNSENVIISHPDKSVVGNIIYNKEVSAAHNSGGADFYYYTETINDISTIVSVSSLDNQIELEDCDFTIISEVSRDSLFSAMKYLNYYVLIIGIVIILIAVLLTLSISNSVVRPLTVLNNKLRAFGTPEEKKFDSASKSKSEIAELEDAYEDMTARIADLIEKNNKEMEKQRELELLALQQEINPHLLYNTLDTIGWIAKLKKQPEIERLIIALANFFRISLHNGDKYIYVSEEIALIENFISIQQIRYPDKISIEYDISDQVAHSLMLKLILQPLVENAIKHGLSQIDGMGKITIRGYMSGDDIVLAVEDNGIGFEVPDGFPATYEPGSSGGGYGLRNVDERIRLEYGEGYGITVTSRVGVGTSATVKIKNRVPLSDSAR